MYGVDMSDAAPNFGVKSRREEYAETTREALLEAARLLFVSEGYGQAGVEAIARAARVTRGAFYHHFEDKAALFEALVERLQAQAAGRVRQAAAEIADPTRRLLVGSAAFLEACVEPDYRRLVIEEAPAVLGAARCRAIEDRYAIGMMVAAISDLHAAGRFQAADPALAARMIAAMLCEAALLIGEAEDPKPLRAATLETVERVFLGFFRD
ncbi:TetR/AcrR family transcriptional regulator [Caulobacter sp. LARHSG274]